MTETAPAAAPPLTLLSVVIPARNEEGCIAATIQHLHLELRLHRVPHEILVIDNFATGKREVVPPVAGLKLIEGSIADVALVERAFGEFGPQLVVHSAAAYKDPADWRERPLDWPATRYEEKAVKAGRRPVYLRFRRKAR